MSNPVPLRPRMLQASIDRFMIVAGEYNKEFTDPLVKHASDTLYLRNPQPVVELLTVPGAFEIPFAVKLVAAQKRHAAILALGVILRGETAHADLIARTITDSLQKIALDHGIPVIHEVLLLDNEDQARARCMGEELNRGREAALAAIEMARITAEFHSPER